MSEALRPWSVADLLVGPYRERDRPDPLAVDEFLERIARALGGRFAARLSSPRAIVLATAISRTRLRNLDDAGLRNSADDLRAALVRHGLTRALAGEAFAHVREATRREFGFEHHDVQLLGGYIMLRGRLAEMRTGEGKTITAMLPAASAALAGMPVHVVTVNDYLAERDAEELRPIYARLGISVGLCQHGQEPPHRRAAYAADVTYCTNKELAFDYLRDRIASRQRASERRLLVNDVLGASPDRHALLLRGLHFAIVDEADSVLIDEARTPLIISAPDTGGAGADLVREALTRASRLEAEQHYKIEASQKLVYLTPDGQRAVAEFAADARGIWRSRRAREEMITQALSALHVFRRDHQYIVSEGKVQIVDEYTGRVMADRKWQRGLQQLIEAKEGVEPSDGRETIAQVTYQRFFRRYLWLAGMTGTAREVADELASVYRLQTVHVPTHRPALTRDLGARFYRSSDDRWAAVAQAASKALFAGQPVLIGTRSVAASERVAAQLATRGIAVAVLNARQDREEAEIVARAGEPGRVTVATNMAGRGTDISPPPEALAKGGLHVILTEYHESARIDRQLFGRTGRQGNPGTIETHVALDDELFVRFAKEFAGPLTRFASTKRLPAVLGAGLRRFAQWRAERSNARIRRETLKRGRFQERAFAFMGRGE